MSVAVRFRLMLVSSRRRLRSVVWLRVVVIWSVVRVVAAWAAWVFGCAGGSWLVRCFCGAGGMLPFLFSWVVFTACFVAGVVLLAITIVTV